MTEVQSRLDLANRIAIEAGKITLKYFRTDQFKVQKKQDGSPLTIADQESEKHLRAEIEKVFPADAIVGEEFGEQEGTSGFTWILDPIDGTKSFISGVPLYGTMVAVTVDEESVIGSCYFPGLDEGIFASKGNGCWNFQGEQAPQKAAVSKNSKLSESVLVTSEVETFAERIATNVATNVATSGSAGVYTDLANAVYFARTWGDVYGYLLVATGRVDIMIDPILQIWDAAAVQPIIEEAGGRFTDWKGVSRIDGGEAVGSNGLVHEEVLRFLS